jgi:hypothetical protein
MLIAEFRIVVVQDIYITDNPDCIAEIVFLLGNKGDPGG